jgi:hypothetical protein
MEVPIMGCGIIDTVTDTIGLTDHAGQKAAQNLAMQDSAFSRSLTTEQLAFQREQYDNWKSIYGDLQENLGNYYKNLSPDDYISRGVTAINKEYEVANKQVTTQLAQRGISNSGIAAAALTSLDQQGAAARANVRDTAGEQVNAQKMGFLGLGLGQGTQMLGINAQVSSNGASNASSLAGYALKTAYDYSKMNSDVMGTLVGGGLNYALSPSGGAGGASGAAATKFFTF